MICEVKIMTVGTLISLNIKSLKSTSNYVPTGLHNKEIELGFVLLHLRSQSDTNLSIKY